MLPSNTCYCCQSKNSTSAASMRFCCFLTRCLASIAMWTEMQTQHWNKRLFNSMFVLMLVSIKTSINYSISKPLLHIFALLWRLNSEIFPPWLRHKPVYLIRIILVDLSGFFTIHARLTLSSALYQNAHCPGIGGFPIDASMRFICIAFSQTVVQFRIDTPLGTLTLVALAKC